MSAAPKGVLLCKGLFQKRAGIPPSLGSTGGSRWSWIGHRAADDRAALSIGPFLKVVVVSIGAQHRLENPGKIDLELIEVQTGSYLGEDDIVRIEDDYHRS